MSKTAVAFWSWIFCWFIISWSWWVYCRHKRRTHLRRLFFRQAFWQIVTPQEFDSLGEPFDFDSIMHEYIETFTVRPKKGKNGIVPKMDRNKRLSAIDIRKTKKLYKCPECGRTYLNKISNEINHPFVHFLMHVI